MRIFEVFDRGRHAAGAVPGGLLRARHQAGRRLDEQLRAPGATAGPEAGGRQQPERAQAAGRPAGAADLRGSHDPVPRVRPCAARHAVERALPAAAGNQRAARLRGVPVAVQRNVGARSAGAGELRPPLPDRRADAAGAAGQGAGGADVRPGLRHHRVSGRGAHRPGLA